jgi:predicted amidohydrolase
MDGETVQMLRGCAKKGNFNVIAGLLIRENDTIYNRALVIDRKGNVAGTYDKNFPTEGEIAGGVRPSDKAACITLDCAKIGIGICFDIHWNRLWETYHNEGADLFCWISAYEGGFSIRKTAIQYRTPLVSSVMPYFARIIEINGEDAASTSRWNRIAYYDLNLDRELFHTDGQMEKIAVVQKKYGERVGVKVFHEEHLFLLENNGAGKTIQDIIDEFGLVPYDEFIKHCTEFRNNHV